MTLTIFVYTLFLINRNDYWIVEYWLSTYVLCCMIYNAAKIKHVYMNYLRKIVHSLRVGV